MLFAQKLIAKYFIRYDLKILMQVLWVCSVVMFTCGCEKSYAKQKKNNNVLSSQSDIAFEQGVDQKPTLKTLYAASKMYIHQGRFDNAESVLQRIIYEYPGFVPAYNDFAEIEINKRHTIEAVEILTKSLEKNGPDPKILNNLGMCWMLRRDYQQALQMFTQAAGIDPANTRYRANMAAVLGLMQRDKEALALYRQILPAEQANKNMDILRHASSISKDTN